MKISIYLALGLVVTGTVLGIAFGYYITPEYRLSMYEKNNMSLGQADRTFDLRYINAMIAHHRGAMLLAEQLSKNTSRPEMKTLAQNILADEPKAIDELYTWKKDWYGDTKTVRDPIVANLGPADEKFDLRFLNAIIAHHEAGIVMTKETREKSSRAEILNNADAVEAFLINGITTLKGIRSSWYNI
ncbi:DUF305 domain-containing protein [Candidatus Woesebacteria bacterium]|jgi:uncharacterized protein (DUF305 family)|nr:DUF305 domain-containing protein [Candidatus Woesebacteria bacterium]